MAELDFDGFALALKSYAGVDTEAAHDARSTTVAQFCRLPVVKVVETMHGEPGDLAAIFSGCMGVPNAVFVRRLQNAKPRAIRDGLQGVLASSSSPFVFGNGDAQQLFSDLCGTVRGSVLVLRVAQCLLWAQNRSDLTPFLYKPGAVRGIRADSDEDAGTVSLDDDADEEDGEQAGVEGESSYDAEDGELDDDDEEEAYV